MANVAKALREDLKKQQAVSNPLEHVVSSELRDGVECECCGGMNTAQTYEDIKGYRKKVVVTHCKDCELSFY